MTVIVFGVSRTAFAEDDAYDSLVVVGAGKIGGWDTLFEFANPESNGVAWALGTHVLLPVDEMACTLTLPPCDGFNYGTAGPNGSNSLLASGIFNGGDTPLCLYVSVNDPSDSTLPAVRATAFHTSGGGDLLSLPVVHLSTIEALVTKPLVFAGVTRSAEEHVNLFLSEVGRKAGCTVLLELLDQGGHVVGSATLTLDLRESISLWDVVKTTFGQDAIGFSQIRLTRTSGAGIPWGILTRVGPGSQVSAAIGAAP